MVREGRDIVGVVLVWFAVLVAGGALFAWIGASLVARAETELSSLVLAQSDQSVLHQLESQLPGISQSSQAQSAVQSALQDPQVQQALATSPGASTALDHELAKLDPTLSGHPVSVDLGRHGFAVLSADLRDAARAAAVAAGVLIALALLVARHRELVLRHAGRWAVVVGAVAIVSSWLVPWIVLRSSHAGTTSHSVSQWLYDDGRGSHVLFVLLLSVGVLAVVAGRVLRGAPGHSGTDTAPALPEGPLPPPPASWP